MNKGQQLYKIQMWKIDEGKIMEANPELKPYWHGSHVTESKKTHSTDHYQCQLDKNGDYILYWSYCGYCNQLRTKKVIWYTEDEGYPMAYVRDIVKGGQFVDD